MKAILYVGHGTRSKKGENEAKAFLQKVMAKVDTPIQEISFLELSSPSIDEGFQRCVERGATEVSVVPILLLTAGHMKHDIPAELAAIQTRHPQIPITLQQAFGVQENILDAIAELVRENVLDLTSEDSILIVGRGSSDPEIHTAFSEIEKGIQERLCVARISSCYLAAAEPKFHDGLEVMLEEATQRVIVIPYLLFSGLLLSEVILWCKKRGPKVIQIDPLSRHKVMEDVVVQIATEGTKHDAILNG
ncbi:sirohydrochlorin chelatase [Robertmurraya yapensis]|uniref:Sirohydrochlorin chelatase n=2 Tax=Bacillaceae TaxID=186817 RepID=A0A431WEU4_9BACI|nr:sirohydrochlorin chelatase [Bacillus yapensis]RTR33885.1 sirohydrochlorin chelatase [Bacillus yapensis]TKS97203.1 sirohydrochlorin chelatase [Bacillus yapensis]